MASLVEHYVAALAVGRLKLCLLLRLIRPYGDDGDVSDVDEDSNHDQPVEGENR